MGSKRSIERKRRKRFAIVCERQTEREYFRAFQEVAVSVYPPRDPVGDLKKLLNDAIRLRNQEDYDQVWLVIDMDHTPEKGGAQFEEFGRIIRKAEQQGVRVAYSVDAIELWFYLHYEYTEQRLERTIYYSHLSNRWGIDYSGIGKSRTFATQISRRLQDDPAANEAEAIRRAKKLYEQFHGDPFRDRNPITTVFILVEALRKG